MAQLLVRGDVRGTARHHDLTEIEDDAGMRHPQGGDRVLLDEQDREVRLDCEPLHELEDLGHDQRRQSERRLVQEKALGRAYFCFSSR